MPIGRCYEQAFWYLMNWGTSEMQLCHGIALQDGPPYVRYGHAWVEVGSRVIEVSDGMPHPSIKSIYYHKSGIDPAIVVRYTREQARSLALQHRHYGPWDPTVAAAVHHREKRGACGCK